MLTRGVSSEKKALGGCNGVACHVGGFGRGVLGAPLGAVFMPLLANMFNLLEMKPQPQNVIIGLIPVTVIVMDGCVNLKKLRKIGRA
jgi:ribose/xylose/arabinose/galactoside ABC-type transport system permease subunit